MARALQQRLVVRRKGRSISNLEMITRFQADGLEAAKSRHFLRAVICMQTSWLAGPSIGLNCIIVRGNWLMLYVQCETSRLSVLAPRGPANPLQPSANEWSYAKLVNIFNCTGGGGGNIQVPSAKYVFVDLILQKYVI